jgi:hypothetical protein
MLLSCPATLCPTTNDAEITPVIDDVVIMGDTQIFQSKCAAVISSSEPYKFLSVSDDLGALFDFAPEQMFGRSIKMLQGPGTNVAQLGAAIKSARLRHHSKIPLTAYSSEGAERNLLVSCAPHLNNVGRVNGIMLVFFLIDQRTPLSQRNPHETNQAPTPANTPPPAQLRNAAEPELFGFAPRSAHRRQRELARARYNRAVGCEIAAQEQQATGLSHSCAAAEREDDMLLLAALLHSVEVE